MKRKFRPSIWLCLAVGILLAMVGVRGWPVFVALNNQYAAHIALTYSLDCVEDHYERYHRLPSSGVVKACLLDHTNVPVYDGDVFTYTWVEDGDPATLKAKGIFRRPGGLTVERTKTLTRSHRHMGRDF